MRQTPSCKFAELYDRIGGRLFAYLASRLGDRQDAADVLQEIFLRIVQAERKVWKADDVDAYVFGMARNEVNRMLSRRKRQRQIQLEPNEIAGQVDSSSAALEDGDFAKFALGQLEPDDCEIVTLKLYGQMTFAQVAEIVGDPASSVATRYQRAIERLRGFFDHRTQIEERNEHGTK